MTHLADPDGLHKWREDAELRRAEQQDTASHEIETLRLELRRELYRKIRELRVEMDQSVDVTTEAIGEVVGGLQKDITDRIAGVLKDIQSQSRASETELFRLVERRFAELAARLDLIAPETRARRAEETFRFAGEKKADDEVVELPNPIVLRSVN
jgi:hypothetical protein